MLMHPRRSSESSVVFTITGRCETVGSSDKGRSNLYANFRRIKKLNNLR
jgi:hypothetical protein